MALDGTRKLATVLTDEARTREEQLEWLWLCIGARRLVLLPHAVDDMPRRVLTAAAAQRA